MHLRSVIKDAVGFICETPLFRYRVEHNARRTLNIVYYHFIGDRTPYYNAFYSGCTISKFANDLKRLSKVFDFVPLGEVVSGDQNFACDARPQVAISFDDGFNLSANGVMDILDRYRIKATTFVITSCLSGDCMMWRHILSAIDNLVPYSDWVAQYHRLERSHGLNPIRAGQSLLAVSSSWNMSHKDEWAAALWEACDLPPLTEYINGTRPYFDWRSLREWVSAGHSVGFHTHTHPYCSKIMNSDVEREIIQPASNLKRELGVSDLSFSYPFGDRLERGIENDLIAKGIFNSYLGIKGFSLRGTSPTELERVGIEAADVGWAVFGRCVLSKSAPVH